MPFFVWLGLDQSLTLNSLSTPDHHNTFGTHPDYLQSKTKTKTKAPRAKDKDKDEDKD